MISDPVVHRKLVLAKNFFIRAEEALADGGSLGRMVAMHHFHIAIEITIRNLLVRYEIQANVNIGFDELLGTLRSNPPFKDSTKKLPYHDQIKIINQRRNDVQHNASDPSEQNVIEAQVFTRRFLIESYASLFEVDFDDLTEFDLIDSPVLRRHLEVAYKLYQCQSYTKAYGIASAAFTWAEYYLEAADSATDSVIDRNHFDRNFKISNDSHQTSLLVGHLGSIADKTNENSNHIKLLSSGIDMKRYASYLKDKPAVSLTMSGRPHIQEDENPEINSVSTLAGIRFVSEAIVKLQSSGENSRLSRIENGAMQFLEQEMRSIAEDEGESGS
jgi:hypothetical protein